MSSASPFRRPSTVNPARGARRIGSILATVVRFAGFWAAVLIPFALVALVITGAAVERVALFGTLLGANVAALRAGKRHRRE